MINFSGKRQLSSWYGSGTLGPRKSLAQDGHTRLRLDVVLPWPAISSDVAPVWCPWLASFLDKGHWDFFLAHSMWIR